MGRRPLNRWHRVGMAAASVVLVACAGGDDDDTLTPLPIEGGTIAPSTAAPAPVVTIDPASGPTTPGGLPIPSVAPGAATTTTTATAAPTGEWDGARFDAGVIETVSTVGAYTAIRLDRWSFTGPVGVTRAAGELDTEPVAAWWTVSPYSNENVRSRQFVLAPTVEVLTLDPADQARACAQPPPASPPAPRWAVANLSALGPTPEGGIAVVTYSPTGQITRIRLTRGC